MGERFDLMQEEIISIEVEDISNTLSTYIEQGTHTLLSFFKSDGIETAFETIKGIGESLEEASKIIVFFRKVASIPDKLFLKKMERYCQGVFDIPIEKRKAYVERVGKARLNEDSVFILGILNRIEELSKIHLLLSLFEAKVDDKINDNTYRRLMILVDRTMYSDLMYLLDNTTDDNIKIENDAEQSLLSNGWLSYAGQTWGTATEEGGFVYNYLDIAKQFCNVVWEYKK